MRKITVFYFEGCPNYDPTVTLIQRVLDELRIEAVVESVEVRGSDDAQRLRFFGSPTVHVEGADIDPATEGRSDYSISCRKYGPSGTPSRNMVVDALEKIDGES